MATHGNGQGVLIYNGKPYAVGLLWFTVQEETGKELLQSRVKKTHADFYCQRMHISMQQAFGWLDHGHRRSMPVAAAMVADQLVGEWHGVFEADNGWWYVQVRSDTITPNGDRFFTTEEEAFNVFQDEMTKHNWPHAYAPDKWRLGDRGIRELPLKTLLDELVTSTLTPANITAVFGSSSTRNIVLGGLTITFAFMAALAIYNTFIKPEPIKPVARMTVQQIIALKKSNQGLQVILPQQLGQACGALADKLYQPLPGWRATEFNCTSASAMMSWQQMTGALGDAKTRGVRLWPSNATINFVNRVLTVSAALDKLPTVEQEKLMSQEEELLYLEQVLKPMGALQLTVVTPPAPPVPKRTSFLDNAAPAPPPKAPPAFLNITFKTGFAPEKIAPLLTSPGLEIAEIKWTIPQALWQYKMKWYFQRAAIVSPVKSGAAPVSPTSMSPTSMSPAASSAPVSNSAAAQAKRLHPLPSGANGQVVAPYSAPITTVPSTGGQ